VNVRVAMPHDKCLIALILMAAGTLEVSASLLTPSINQPTYNKYRLDREWKAYDVPSSKKDWGVTCGIKKVGVIFSY
jgi:hypothetical protein